MKKEKIYIVEGEHDISKLKQVDPKIKVLHTGGMHLKKEFINQLKKLEKSYQIILLLDPDFAGENIRRKLAQNLTNPTHIYVEKTLATNTKGDVRIENLKISDLRDAIQNERINAQLGDIDTIFLINHGYLSKPYSKELRLKLTSHFKIGYTNGKGLAERLNLYNITRQKILEYEKEEKIRSTFFDK